MKRLLILSITLFLSLFPSCVKEETLWIHSDDDKNVVISLQMIDQDVVSTKASKASENERIIEDAYILLFSGSTGKYIDGERVTSINDNGQGTPSLTTSLSISTGDTIVVLANTGCTFTDIPLSSSSTINNINTAFLSTNWNINRLGDDSGKGMPMSGIVEWNSETKPSVQMYRSVAKIQLLLDITDGDITSSFTKDADAVKWGLFNAAQKGDIFSSNNRISTPLKNTYKNNDARSYRIKGASGATLSQQTLYTPEYPSSIKARGASVSPSTFAIYRTCIIVSTSAGYYRIDLATGNDEGQAKTFLDINRNTHYMVTISKVLSYGYSTAKEAFNNPPSNLEYKVETIGEEENFTTSNGQYAVTTDKSQAAVYDKVTTAESLVKFFCNSNGLTTVTTRKVRLVKADKKTIVPITQIQMCKSDGTAIANNTFVFTSADDAGCQLKFTSSYVPTEKTYVEICYGNIRHYVPMIPYFFSVSESESFQFYGGETKNYKVGSSRIIGNSYEPVPWAATEFSVDGGVTWKTTMPDWMTTFTGSGPGTSFSLYTYDVSLSVSPDIEGHSVALQTATPVSGIYNLANATGAAPNQNTANCYLVNAPGHYSLPLVYGNAIKDGSDNKSAYSSKITTASNVLSPFIKGDGLPITTPFITGAVSATLVWQDGVGLVTDVSLSDGKLLFYVNKNTIRQGNALVAVNDASGNVLWSWHIWITDYKLGSDIRSFTNHQNERYQFMPINVGWCYEATFPSRTVMVRFTQAESGIHRILSILQLEGKTTYYSPYYQWGRKDPFFSHNTNMYKANGGGFYYSKSFFSFGNTCIATGILNPAIFNKSLYGDNTYLNLWSSDNDKTTANDLKVVKTVYDPSPVGYHLPASNAFTGFTTTGGYTTNNYDNMLGKYVCSPGMWKFFRPGSDEVSFYGMDLLEEELIADYGTYGFYYAATPYDESGGRNLKFTGHQLVAPTGVSFKFQAMSVRCVKE